MLAYESGVTNTVDPLAGSYFVEALTDRMEREAVEYIQRIDDMGGMIEAIAAGFPQKEIADAAYRYQRQLEDGSKTLVGVNRYVSDEDNKPEILKIGEDIEHGQVERLRRIRSERDEQRVQRSFDALRKGAEAGDNLIPLMLESVRAYASVGEISKALIPVFGIYRETSVF